MSLLTIVPVYRLNAHLPSVSRRASTTFTELWFNPFTPIIDHSEQVRGWLHKPNNLQKYPNILNFEKFRVVYDVNGYNQDKLKFYIESGSLTISAVKDGEDSLGVEKKVGIPPNIDIETMAAYITQHNQLIIDIPLIENEQKPPLDERRLSFSMQRTTDNQHIEQANDHSKNLIINIPDSFIRSGKMLTIQKPLDTTGHHQPYLIRYNQDLCLLDSQYHPTITAATSFHDQPMANNNNSLVKIQIELSPETLRNGKTVTFQRPTNNPQETNFQIPSNLIENGKTIHIQNNRIISEEQQHHHLNENQFAKTDHLKAKNMMELNIEIPSELLSNGQTITVGGEKLSIDEGHHQTHHNDSQGTPAAVTDDHQQHLSVMNEFLLNKTWNPSITVDTSNGQKLLNMLLKFPSIILRPDEEIHVVLNGYDLRIEYNISNDKNTFTYRQVKLPAMALVDELKCHFDDQDICLHIQVPLKWT